MVAGDPSPDGKGTLGIARGIEVGHVFQLGQKYSRGDERDRARRDRQGSQLLHMGCYGIGVTRIVAAAIEQNHDARGIIWPEPSRPSSWWSSRSTRNKSPRVETAERLYDELLAAGVDVLLDDRDQRPGVSSPTRS